MSQVKQLAWGLEVTMDFCDAVLAMADRFNWSMEQASYLMACMAFETGESFSPAVKNAAGSGATGLIQFMPATARGLGTTTTHLAQLNAVEQLFWVEAYFKPYAKRVKTLSDMYMAILMPKYIGYPEYAVLFDKGIAYRQNAGLDSNKDGDITKAEAAQKVAAKLERGMHVTRARLL